jgi:hypothetical protein
MISTKKTNAIFCNENQLKLTQGKKKKKMQENSFTLTQTIFRAA